MQQELARAEYEKKLEIEKMEREERAEKLRLEQEAYRLDYEKIVEGERLEREMKIETMRIEQEKLVAER